MSTGFPPCRGCVCLHSIPPPSKSGAVPDIPSRYLEIGNRDDADAAHYPDDDLAFAADGSYVHKDGRPY